LRKAQQDLDRKNRALWKLAHHDALTGMLNRRAFDRDWNDARQLLRRRRIEIGLVLFDVNRFKAINDTYGHQAGDEVLKAISHGIQSTLRQGEQLYRIGGDEFASILIGSSAEEMLTLTRRCLEAIEGCDFSALGLRETVRVSCGIAYCPAEDHQRLDKLQWQADVAVYQAKKPGSHGPVLFDDSMANGSQSIFSSWINEAVYQAVTSGRYRLLRVVAAHPPRKRFHSALAYLSGDPLTTVGNGAGPQRYPRAGPGSRRPQVPGHQRRLDQPVGGVPGAIRTDRLAGPAAPVDTIKFDIALIQGMEDDRIHQLVQELARMLSGLGYELVAEGIETKEIFERVIDAGFTHAQGFYLDTPKRHHGNEPSS